MDGITSLSGSLPSHVVNDPFFQPTTPDNTSSRQQQQQQQQQLREHSSRLLTEETKTPTTPPEKYTHKLRPRTDVEDVDKEYTWQSILDDKTLTDKLTDIYAMRLEKTGKCHFDFQVRNILGDWLCPSVYHTSDLFSKGKNAAEKKATAKMIIDQVLTFVCDMKDEELIGATEDWAAEFGDRTLLIELYDEIEVKFSREKSLCRRHKEFAVTRTTNVTLYTNEKPRGRVSTMDNSSSSSSKSLDQDSYKNPLSSSSSSLPEKGPHPDVKEFQTLDETIRTLRRQNEKLDTLSAHADKIDHDRYYHSLSLALFSKCILLMFVLSLPFSIICQDAWQILITGPYALVLGIWGFLLSRIIPRYKGLDLFTLFTWVVTFGYATYVMLRSSLYNYGDCSVNDFELGFTWLVLLFGAMISVFSTTLSGIRKKVKDWEAQRRLRPVQRIVGKEV